MGQRFVVDSSKVNYQAHYDRLIQRARNRALDCYIEVHHVIPRCIGGDNSKNNLVQLTPEEHYVAHQLLHKIHPRVKGLSYAMFAMTTDRYGKRCNKLYGWVRRRWIEAVSIQSKDRWLDPEYREKHKEAMQKVFDNPEFGEKISKANKGRVKTEQERKNIAEAGRKRTPRVFSEQAKSNMSAARMKTWQERRESGEDKVIGQKTKETRIKNGSYAFTDEHRENISKSQIGREPWNKGITGYSIQRN